MMHGPEKSDPGIVAMKPANKTEQSVADANRLRPWWLSLEKCAEHRGPSFLEVGVALQSALQQSLDSLLRFGPRERSARRDLCGARGAILVPTATMPYFRRELKDRPWFLISSEKRRFIGWPARRWQLPRSAWPFLSDATYRPHGWNSLRPSWHARALPSCAPAPD